MSHTIRLRDPWQHEPAPAGGMRWMRAFHFPTGLTEREVVWLVVSGDTVSVQLGDQLLKASVEGSSSRYDITALLAEHNRLTVEVPEANDKRPFEVSLEICRQ